MRNFNFALVCPTYKSVWGVVVNRDHRLTEGHVALDFLGRFLGIWIVPGRVFQLVTAYGATVKHRISKGPGTDAGLLLLLFPKRRGHRWGKGGLPSFTRML